MPSNSELHNKFKNADQPEFSYLLGLVCKVAWELEGEEKVELECLVPFSSDAFLL